MTTYQKNHLQKEHHQLNHQYCVYKQHVKCITNYNIPFEELSENFYIDNHRRQNVKIQVKLTANGIYLRRESEQDDHTNEQLIQMDEIIGTRCGPRLKRRTRGGLNSCKRIQETNEERQDNIEEVGDGGREVGKAYETTKTNQQQQNNDTSAYLYIYAYIRKEKPLRRVQTLRILRFRTHNHYEQNLKNAERWHHAIQKNKGKYRPNIYGKQLLILLNPKSGSGKGRELFQKQVAPLLREAEIQYDLQITTHRNFALEFVRTRKTLLTRYNGIVVASGDGLFHEVLNGLMERMDWRTVCRELPLGVIPCGSGNGLAKSIAHHSNEPYEPKPILHATLTCVSGKTTPMDVVRVELAKNGSKHEHCHIMYSFLSIGWGLIADIDIESERWRSLGPQRFTLWAIRRLITLRSYHGKLYYLPLEIRNRENEPHQQQMQVNAEKETSIWKEENHDNEYNPEFNYLQPDGDEKPNAVKEVEVFMDVDDSSSITVSEYQDFYSQHEKRGDSWQSGTSRRTTYYSLGGQSSSRSNRNHFMNITNRVKSGHAKLTESIPTGTIPSLKMPLLLEDGWSCEEDDYIMIHAAYTTHLASDCYFIPESKLNDGIIYLVVIRSGVSRSQLLNFFLGMSAGTHLPAVRDPYIRLVPVRAFRIEPNMEQQGIMAVDGERVDYGAIQAEIFPGMINVMANISG